MTTSPTATHEMDATSPRGTHGEEPDGLRRDAWLLTLGTLLLHGGLALALPMPGLFNKYGLAARHYLEGILPSERLMDFSPFYFHLSVLLQRLSDNPQAWLQAFQLGLAAASVGLLYVLARRRFRRPWALLAGALLALDPLLLVYERILEPEIFQLFFLLAVMTLLPMGGRYTPWLTGVLAACCVATRPTFLPVFLAAPLYYAWQRRRARRSEAGPSATPGNVAQPLSWQGSGAAVVLPVALMLMALLWRAETATGDWRAPMMNPGTVFFEGNQPLSRGTSAMYPPVVLNFIQHDQGEHSDSGHSHYRRVARASLGETASLQEVNAYWSERAWSFMRQEPGVALERLLGKMLYAFHGFRWHDITTAWSYEASLPLPSVPFALLAALALFGTLFEARRWTQSALFYLLMAMQLAVMLVFYVSARQRLALLPAIIYFAVVAAERLRGHRHRRVALAVGILVLAFTLWLPDAAMRDEAYRRQGFQNASSHFDAARTTGPENAEQDIVDGFVQAPWALKELYPSYVTRSPESLEARILHGLLERQVPAAFDESWRFDAATLAYGLDPSRLEELLTPLFGRTTPPVYRGSRHSSQPILMLARLEIERGRVESARRTLQDALQTSPGDPFVLAELIAMGDDDASQRMQAYWGEADGRYLVGQAQLRQGHIDDAVATFEALLASLPEFRDARVLLAAALGYQGRYDAGVEQYLRAAAEQVEPIVLPEGIIHLFRGWVDERPDDAQRLFYGAQVLHRHGELEIAHGWLNSRPPPPSVAEPWNRELARLERRLAGQR